MSGLGIINNNLIGSNGFEIGLPIPVSSPSIINDGLLVYLNGSNSQNYSTTKWFDLSGKKHDFIISNGGTFSNGMIELNSNKGASNTDTISELLGDANVTFGGVFYRYGNFNYSATCGIGGTGGGMNINTYNLDLTNHIAIDLYGTATISTGQIYPYNQNVYIMWVKRAGGFNRDNISIYINGVEYTGTNLTYLRGGDGGAPNLTTGLAVGHVSPFDGYHANAVNVSEFQVYTKALSSSEIAHNYTIMQSRYGIS